MKRKQTTKQRHLASIVTNKRNIITCKMLMWMTALVAKSICKPIASEFMTTPLAERHELSNSKSNPALRPCPV